MATFEALNAYYGDCILLHFEEGGEKRRWLVDGGPNSGAEATWRKVLLPRLEELRGAASKLPLDLVMVSHADGDHIQGLLAMMKAMNDTSDRLTWVDIQRFWHNSFEDLAGANGAGAADVDAAAMAAVGANPLQALKSELASAEPARLSGLPPETIDKLEEKHRVVAMMATIEEGRELRDYLNTLGLNGNDPFGGFIAAPAKKPVDGVMVHVIGPIGRRVEKFREKWFEVTQKPASPGRTAELAELVGGKWDNSPTNLSSLVLLFELDGHRIMLTGDARADDIIAGFRDCEFEDGRPYPLSVLKMPHHGSDRNLSTEFIEKFPARHYVISGDGHHDNPDTKTLRAIIETRGAADDYTIHITNEVPGHRALLDGLRAGRRFNYVFRDPARLSMEIPLPPGN